MTTFDHIPDAIRKANATRLTFLFLGFAPPLVQIVFGPAKEDDPEQHCAVVLLGDGTLKAMVKIGPTGQESEAKLHEKWLALSDTWNAADEVARDAEWRRWQSAEEVTRIGTELELNGLLDATTLVSLIAEYKSGGPPP